MAYDNQPEQKLSKYNSAVAQLYRLDALWQAAQYHSRAGQLRKWNWDLDAIWRELAGDATEKHKRIFYRFNKIIIKVQSNNSFLYQVLERKEIFLGTMKNQQGKGTAYLNPDEDLLED